MSKKDYYEILEIDRNATEQDIKKAYKKLSKIHHPDVGGNEESFKEISEVYNTLSDKAKRQNYDRFGHNNQRDNFNPFEGFNPFEFTRQQRRRPTGRDLRVSINLTLEEIFNGASKTFKYKRNEPCTSCNGEGGHNKITCPKCNGSGHIVSQVLTQFGIMQSVETCNHCDGHGTTYSETCTTCNGSGVQRIENEVTIDIPASIQDGVQMRYDGMGDFVKGGLFGGLYVSLNELKHDKFVRDNNDLRYNLKLSYPDLVLGAKVEIPTIEGSIIRVSVPEYSKVGDNLRIVKKGFMMNQDRGDMFIMLDIDMPNKIDNEERELLENLKNIKEKVAQ